MESKVWNYIGSTIAFCLWFYFGYWTASQVHAQAIRQAKSNVEICESTKASIDSCKDICTKEFEKMGC